MLGRGKETFISAGDLYDPEYSAYASHLLLFNIDKMYPIFIGHVEQVIKSNNHLLVTIKELCKMVDQDPRLAHHLEPRVVEHIVEILEQNDNKFIRSSAAYILSRVKNDKQRGTIIREKAIPVLVDLMSNDSHPVAVAVVITLTRLACLSSDYLRVILDRGALKIVRRIGPINWDTDIMVNLAKFMAVVCQATLRPDEESLALTILEELLQRTLFTLRHIQTACFALSYLSYERHVEIKQETFKGLIEFLGYSDVTVVTSAFGVLGNIVRWGDSDQIEILAKDTEFLRFLGTCLLVSKPKKFQLEACHIISKIAAQSLTFKQDVQKAGLIDLLEKLVAVDDSVVKIEAKRAISVANMHGYQ